MTPTFVLVCLLTWAGAWQVGCTIGRHVGRLRRAKPVPRPWGALPDRPQLTSAPVEPEVASGVTEPAESFSSAGTEKVMHHAPAQ